MANYNDIKQNIAENLPDNGKGEITAAKLRSTLNEFVDKVETTETGMETEINAKIARLENAGYQFAGVATKDTNPNTPEAKVFYIADGKGVYTNFGGISVTEDEVVVLYYDTTWHKEVTGIASNQKLTELEQKCEILDTIDDEPTVNSSNLVKSGGVASQISQLDYKVNGGTIVLGSNTNPPIWSEKMVNAQGQLINDPSSQYKLTNPILLDQGENIQVSQSYGTMHRALYKTDSALSYITPLTTSNKDVNYTATESCYVVAFINADNTAVYSIEKMVSGIYQKIGDLNTLETSVKTSVVGAINELHSDIEEAYPTGKNLVSGTDFTLINGSGIGVNGYIAEHDAYWRTSSVAVRCGDVISYTGEYNNGMSVISRTDENQNFYFPILKAALANKKYKVEIDFDGYVVFSGNIDIQYITIIKKSVSDTDYMLAKNNVLNMQKSIVDDVESFIEENNERIIRYEQESRAAYIRAKFERETMLAEVHAMTDNDVLVGGDCGYIINNDDPEDVTHGTIKWKIFKNGILYIYGYGRMYDFLKGTQACITIQQANNELSSILQNYPYNWYYGFLPQNLNGITPPTPPDGYRYEPNGELMTYSNKRYMPSSHGDTVNDFIRVDCGFSEYNKPYGYSAPWYIYRTEVDPSYQPQSYYNEKNPTNIRYSRICIEEDTTRGGITYIGDWAFYRASCNSLVLPEHVTHIGCWSIRYSPVVTTVVMGDLVTQIEDHGISRMEALEYCRLSSTLTTLGFEAMASDPSLRMITIPRTLSEIPTRGFYANRSLDRVIITSADGNASQISNIGFQAFSMSNMSLFEMPLSVPVVTMEVEAFTGCKIPIFNIPSTTTTIKRDAFVSNVIKKIVIDSETIASTSTSTNSGGLFNSADVLYIKNTISDLSNFIKSDFVYFSTIENYNVYIRYKYSKNIVVETITD